MTFHLAVASALALGLSVSASAHYDEFEPGEEDFFVNQCPKERKALQNETVFSGDVSYSSRSSNTAEKQNVDDELDDDWANIGPSSTDFQEDFTYQSSWLPEFIRPIGGHLVWDALDQFVSVVAPAWAYTSFSLWKTYPSEKVEESTWNPFTWRATSQVGKYAEFGVKVVETCIIGSHPYIIGWGRIVTRFM